MRRLLPLLLLPLVALTACDSGTPFEFVDGIYEAADEEIWLDVRADDREVVFYDAAGATVDADGHVQGDELHRDTMDILIQEERGEACGDEFWYQAAMLDGMVTFELDGVWFSWPTLVWDCDQIHLLLSDDPMVMDCDGDEVCLQFEPR